MSAENMITKSIKLVILGNFGSGKTSLRRRFMGQGFTENYSTTIGVDFANYQIQYDDETKYNCQIWDIAGQTSFLNITKSFMEHVNAVVLVFDLTRPSTKLDLEGWVAALLERNAHRTQQVPMIILGNKLDLIDTLPKEASNDPYIVMLSDYESLDYEKLAFLSTSAKTGENVDLAFKALISKLHVMFSS